MKRHGIAVGFGICAAILLASGCAKKTTTAKGKLETIHFDFDEAVIRTDAEPVLKGNASWVKGNPGTKVTIEGHCDERGTNEYNIALGDRRANAAKRYLVNLGVDKGKLSTVSYGEEKPVAKCHDESCWLKNRRADFNK